MTDDLVKRLRAVGGLRHDGATQWYVNPDGLEAADEIERLRAALTDAIKIAKTGWLTADCGVIGDADYGNELCEYIADAISARAALAEQNSTEEKSPNEQPHA